MFKKLENKHTEDPFKLKESVTGQHIIGTHCYDILANRNYQKRFMYIPNYVNDRAAFTYSKEGALDD